MEEVKLTETTGEEQYIRQVLKFAFDVGELLCENGAEVWRVEETIPRILEGFHVPKAEAMLFYNAIILTYNDDKRTLYAKAKFISRIDIHFSAIVEINELSRMISSGKITLEEAEKQLEKIRMRKETPNYKLYFGAFLGAGCFTYLMFGGVMNSLFAAIAAYLTYLAGMLLARRGYSKLISKMLCGAIVSALASLFQLFPDGIRPLLFPVVIGGIMPMLPGVRFVNAIRDFANTYYISAVVQLSDALLDFIYLAVGASTVISVLRFIY